MDYCCFNLLKKMQDPGLLNCSLNDIILLMRVLVCMSGRGGVCFALVPIFRLNQCLPTKEVSNIVNIDFTTSEKQFSYFKNRFVNFVQFLFTWPPYWIKELIRKDLNCTLNNPPCLYVTCYY